MIQTEQDRLKNLIFLSNEISEVKDLDVLMERILASARDFVNCDAGSIYIIRDDQLQFSYSQNNTLAQRLRPGEKLVYTTFSMPITNRSIAGQAAISGKILNIPDAYLIPSTEKYHFDKSFDTSTNYRTHSMLTVPLKMNTGKIIGVLQLINAKNVAGEIIGFDPEMEPFVMYFANNAAAALERAQLMRQTLLRMISMAELRDPKETGNHVNRVAGYAVEIYETIARKEGIPAPVIDKKRDVLRMAGMLHDVGKVAISDTILKKPGRLTDEEYAVMKQHTIIGARMFRSPSSELDIASQEVALNHHERWDGRGYPGFVDILTGEVLPHPRNTDEGPAGKREEEIPLFGRIVALADVYDALSCKRCYKEAMGEDRVLEILSENRGTQFDPSVVDAFFACLPIIRSLASRYPEQE